VSTAQEPACPRCGSNVIGVRRIRRFGYFGTVFGMVLLLPSAGVAAFGGLSATSIFDGANGVIGFMDVVNGGGPTADARQRRLIAAVRANAAICATGLLGVLIGAGLRSRRYARSCLTCESERNAAPPSS
jgi:hypothetical protein